MKTLVFWRFMRQIATAGAVTVLLLVSLGLAQTERIPGSYVTTTTINVRRGPGTSYEIVAKIPTGVKVQVIGKEGEWLRVESKHGNPPGYIDARYVRPAGGQEAGSTPPATGIYTTTADVNVRRGPGLSYEVVAKIPRDTEVEIVGAEGNWLKVQSKHGNPPGYIEKRSAQPR